MTSTSRCSYVCASTEASARSTSSRGRLRVGDRDRHQRVGLLPRRPRSPARRAARADGAGGRDRRRPASAAPEPARRARRPGARCAAQRRRPRPRADPGGRRAGRSRRSTPRPRAGARCGSRVGRATAARRGRGERARPAPAPPAPTGRSDDRAGGDHRARADLEVIGDERAHAHRRARPEPRRARRRWRPGSGPPRLRAPCDDRRAPRDRRARARQRRARRADDGARSHHAARRRASRWRTRAPRGAPPSPRCQPCGASNAQCARRSPPAPTTASAPCAGGSSAARPGSPWTVAADTRRVLRARSGRPQPARRHARTPRPRGRSCRFRPRGCRLDRACGPRRGLAPSPLASTSGRAHVPHPLRPYEPLIVNVGADRHGARRAHRCPTCP